MNRYKECDPYAATRPDTRAGYARSAAGSVRSGRGLIWPVSPSCGGLPHESEDDVTERVARKT